MLYKTRVFPSIWRSIYLFVRLPYVSLLVWLIPLILCNSGQNSLMAHDEGFYAGRARQMFESGDWIAPWGTAHHKTPGSYWLIATAYRLLGVSEFSARLPSAIAGIFCLFTIYEIAKIILSQKVAWLTAIILSVEFLWLQSCRLAAPDIPTILLVMLGILSFLKSELSPDKSYFWLFIAGLSFSLGFLLRSFVIFLPMVALLPYLIGEHRRHQHLFNPMFYVGLVVGSIPTLVWLGLSWLRFGNDSIGQLLGFVVELGSEDRNHNGFFFYFWNIPLKSFPWFFFSLLGMAVVIKRPIPRYQLLVVGFPIVLFTELSIFSTRLSHYALCLYPFIALLAAVGLDWLGKMYQQGFTPQTQVKKYLPRNLSYAFGVFSIVLLCAGILALNYGDAYLKQRAIPCLILGLGWLTVPLIWIARHRFGQKFLSNNYWLASWLIPCWLTLAMAGNLGFLGDYNPNFKAFFQQPAIASILQSHPVYFAQFEDKNSVLLNFYTPIPAARVRAISQVPILSYAWISADNQQLSTPYRVIATLQEYQLIQVLP
ncbi:hypothetical protein NIES22_07990 [Calothrix brevissima NIES-22]|nr:hypothetical protein NIES22_07990 [Calothrix brevissima NIES-22]